MRGQTLIATLVSLLPVVLLWLGSVTQLEGGLLLVVFVGYTFFLLRADREAVMRLAAAEGDEDEDDEDEDTGDTDDGEQPLQVRTHIGFHWKPVLLTFGGLVAMAVGGPATVEGALPFAAFFGLSRGVVRATVVSLGTGAGMIALGVSAARKKRSNVLVVGFQVPLPITCSSHLVWLLPFTRFLWSRVSPCLLTSHGYRPSGITCAYLVWEVSAGDRWAAGRSVCCLPPCCRVCLRVISERSPSTPGTPSCLPVFFRAYDGVHSGCKSKRRRRRSCSCIRRCGDWILQSPLVTQLNADLSEMRLWLLMGKFWPGENIREQGDARKHQEANKPAPLLRLCGSDERGNLGGCDQYARHDRYDDAKNKQRQMTDTDHRQRTGNCRVTERAARKTKDNQWRSHQPWYQADHIQSAYHRLTHVSFLFSFLKGFFPSCTPVVRLTRTVLFVSVVSIILIGVMNIGLEMESSPSGDLFLAKKQDCYPWKRYSTMSERREAEQKVYDCSIHLFMYRGLSCMVSGRKSEAAY